MAANKEGRRINRQENFIGIVLVRIFVLKYEDMNNIEFCKLINDARELAGITILDLVMSVRKSEGSIRDVFKARADYTMPKYLPIIQAMGFCLVITNNTRSIKLQGIKDISEWVVDSMRGFNVSSYELGKMLEISQTTALSLLKGGPIRLSVFLKLAELTNSKVSIEAII